MTPADLSRYGVALLGDRWQRPLAALLRNPHTGRLGIDDRLVRRWVSGARTIPEWVEGQLRGMAIERIAELRGLLR